MLNIIELKISNLSQFNFVFVNPSVIAFGIQMSKQRYSCIILLEGSFQSWSFLKFPILYEFKYKHFTWHALNAK